MTKQLVDVVTDAEKVAVLKAALVEMCHHAVMIREACLFGRQDDVSATAYARACMIMRVADDARRDER